MSATASAANNSSSALSDPHESLPGMDADAAKADLHRYLRQGGDAVLWKLDGLSERDARRPLTPTGTNLLGLVKHLANVEAGYFGATFGRPFPAPLAHEDDTADEDADMYATAQESIGSIVDFYGRACAHADATVTALPLDAVGHVPWWPPNRAGVTLHRILIHVATETHRHAGHADIVRELIDGTAGLRRDSDNLVGRDAAAWSAHRDRLQMLADDAEADAGL